MAEMEVALAGVAEAMGVTVLTEASSLTAFDQALTVCGDDLGTPCARLARPGRHVAEALLFVRGAASRAFEVSQLDEMLTWMKHQRLPFVSTTNRVERMDAAAPRRFTLKLRFNALDPARADPAFRRLPGTVSPVTLSDGLPLMRLNESACGSCLSPLYSPFS